MSAHTSALSHDQLFIKVMQSLECLDSIGIGIDSTSLDIAYPVIFIYR
jgi:hypothetical protein